MRTVPERSPWLVFATSAGCLVSGPLLGSLLARGAAPGSETAQFVSPVAFFLAFLAGVLLWFAIGAVGLVGGGVWRLLSGRIPSKLDTTEELVPPGYGVFVPLGVVLGLVAGGIAAVTSDGGSFVWICGPHVLAGLLYGAALRALAHHGYLPFPEPS
ncbi:MAG: hypothetical protein QNK04_19120 [Myxococcota bacterium]|nr:hypothetical protein [Myxococcota bacterium]